MATTITRDTTSPPEVDDGFTGQVVVRRLDYQWWLTEEEITYFDGSALWVAPEGTKTDFASVPRLLTWLVPRTGRYDRAAIIHDHLCDHLDDEGITRFQADEVFRHALRDLGVAFLRRWFMWGAVRVASVRRDAPGWARSHSVFLIALLAAPALLVALVPAAMIVAGLGLFFAFEWTIYWALRLTHRVRGRPASERVNPPVWSWRV